MKTSRLAVIAIILIPVCVWSQQHRNWDAPQREQEEALAQVTPVSLDSFFIDYMSTHHVPGIAACLVKKDSIIWEGYYGYANLAQSTPVTDSTIFNLASISKTVMVTALMQLFERGYFQLDDPINAYLPFAVSSPAHPEVPITFRMLLTHTSSLRDNWNVLEQLTGYGDPTISLGIFLQQYLVPGGPYYSASQNFYSAVPGTYWSYCNVGAALAGYLVEVMSGIPFDQYCRDSIFVPLQMNHTAWFLRDLDTSLVAHPYGWSGSYHDYGLRGYPDYPDGLLRTTLRSLAKFLMMNIEGGESGSVRILDTTTVRLMRTVYVPVIPAPWNLYQWGLIWFKPLWSKHDLWGHTGGDYGVTTAMFLKEEDSTGIVLLTNGEDHPYKTVVEVLFDQVSLVPYAHDVMISRRSVDTICVTARVENSRAHTLNVVATLTNGSGMLIDSLFLADDGLHGDSTSGDGVWGCLYVPVRDDTIHVGIRTDDQTAGTSTSLPDAAIYFFTRGAQISVDTRTVNFGRIKDMTVSRDTTFMVWNIGFAKDSLYVTLDHVNVTPDSAIAVSPTAFALAGGDSAGVTFSVCPPILAIGYYNAQVLITSRFGFGQTSFSKLMQFQVVTDVTENEALPTAFALEQNYPNPFNPVTNIGYEIADFGLVRLVVYDILGHEVAVLMNEKKAPGRYKVQFDARNLASGMYFYRLNAGHFVAVKKLIVLR